MTCENDEEVEDASASEVALVSLLWQHLELAEAKRLQNGGGWRRKNVKNGVFEVKTSV